MASYLVGLMVAVGFFRSIAPKEYRDVLFTQHNVQGWIATQLTALVASGGGPLVLGAFSAEMNMQNVVVMIVYAFFASVILNLLGLIVRIQLRET